MKKSAPSALSAIAAALLAGCAPSGPAGSPAPSASAPPPAAVGDYDAGKKVFLRVCFVCHLVEGTGVSGVFPPLAGSEVVAGDPARLVRIVLHGLQGPVTVHGATYDSVMPAQGPTLSDTEIADVLTYVRGAWKNRADPVPLATVRALRASSSRSTPWTWAELNQQ